MEGERDAMVDVEVEGEAESEAGPLADVEVEGDSKWALSLTRLQKWCTLCININTIILMQCIHTTLHLLCFSWLW